MTRLCASCSSELDQFIEPENVSSGRVSTDRPSGWILVRFHAVPIVCMRFIPLLFPRLCAPNTGYFIYEVFSYIINLNYHENNMQLIGTNVYGKTSRVNKAV